MGRKRKCKYCRNSNLTDVEFELVLCGWVMGFSAQHTAEEMMRLCQLTRSEKTILSYYSKIGLALFERFVIPILAPVEEQSAKEQNREPNFEEFYDYMHSMMIDTDSPMYDWNESRRITKIAQTNVGTLDFMSIMLDYREASKEKYGVGARIKETLAWAFVREAARAEFRFKDAPPTWIGDDHIKIMMRAITDIFTRQPC